MKNENHRSMELKQTDIRVGRMLSVIMDEEKFEAGGSRVIRDLNATHLLKCHIMPKNTNDKTAIGSESLQEALSFIHGHASSQLGLFAVGERSKELIRFAVGSGLVPAECVVNETEERLEALLAFRRMMMEKESDDIVDCGGI